VTGQPVGGVAGKAFPVARSEARLLVPALMFIALVVAAVASLGTPLITSVATSFHVSLGSAQWTLTVALLSGAVATPVLGRLGAGPHRRATILATLAVVVAGSALTVLPLPFAWLLAGRAAQGVGLGLTALMMGVARDHLPEARGGAVIALTTHGDTKLGSILDSKVDVIIEIPHAPELLTPILYAIPVQLLAYHVAVLKGTDVDQPRNLAKSVTVE